MTYGNYDAGKSRPVSNPFLDGGLRRVDTAKTYDFGFNKTEKAGSPWGVEITTRVTPEQRVATATTRSYAAVSSVADNADNDRFVDEYLGAYITPETRERMASTSFNVAMAMGDFEEAYKNLV